MTMEASVSAPVPTEMRKDLSSSSTNSKNIKNKVVAKESAYWNEFYAKKFTVGVPSQFCVMVGTEAPKTQPFVEFGCGNGRDSMYLARQGFRVYGCDLSGAAIQKLQQEVTNADDAQGGVRADFSVCDVSDANAIRDVVHAARGTAVPAQNVTLYNRFFLHALDDEQEKIFLSAVADACIPGDLLYIETRCSLDEELDKEHGKNHFRRYVKSDELIESLVSLGFGIHYKITGQGMAKYKAEDPFVTRIICERKN
eukprot:CAMPEP_0178918082 /NCGR_PEP_ID=MMETSP0786-20121207/13625_1 /TAXON_ID=186022 /ORGANISM="Thalassionema frauenfeldii, Strain CCMP 1798" /LENGTH=253 /DNA_ID=CAMNT_0020591745 /DNA_START=90 /DNA_END=851 /DNA_ORIENTATION=-